MAEPLLSIGTVAQRFGVRASALRYYEQIGLLKPTTRGTTTRYYGEAELERLALIQILKEAGRLSLEDIARILTSHGEGAESRQILVDRIDTLDEQIRAAEAARSYLSHRLECPRENPFDDCPVLAGEVNRRLEAKGVRRKRGDLPHQHCPDKHRGAGRELPAMEAVLDLSPDAT